MRRSVVAFIPQLLVVSSQTVQHRIPSMHGGQSISSRLRVERIEYHGVSRPAARTGILLRPRRFRIIERILRGRGVEIGSPVRRSIPAWPGGRRPPGDRERDVSGHEPLGVQHGLAERLHGVAVGLLQQRYAVHVQELVVGAEALVARGGPAVDDALYEDAEVLRAARLALDADAEAGLFRIVHGDVEGQYLAVFPREYRVAVRFFWGLETRY